MESDVKMNDLKKVLFVAAHPDDEVLGCGGTIARLSREGHEVFIAILGEGITSRYAKREEADQKLICELKEKSKKVAKLLGATDLFMYDLPDNRFDTVPLLNIIKIVENLVAKLKPNVIYTHHGGDLNIDHVVLHRVVLTVTRPTVNQSVKEIYTFEVPSSTDWTFGQFGYFKPQMFFDVKDSVGLKIKAMEIYESEVREFPHPRSSEAIKTIARKWGSVVGVEYAEAFETVRRIL